MSGQIDVRTTLGWRLCPHARTAARIRAVPIREVLEVVAAPEITYSAFDYSPGRYVYQRADLAVVAIPEQQLIITILWRRQGQWTDQEFAARKAPGVSLRRRLP